MLCAAWEEHARHGRGQGCLLLCLVWVQEAGEPRRCGLEMHAKERGSEMKAWGCVRGLGIWSQPRWCSARRKGWLGVLGGACGLGGLEIGLV